VIADADGALQTPAIEIRDGEMKPPYWVANPDKLRDVGGI
jgi:hypothetical protein